MQQMPINEAEKTLLWLLNECSQEVENNRHKNGVDFGRVMCETCNASRSLFCAECARLLIPHDQWPLPIRDRSLYLPFDVDIILNDRRLSATGVQLYTIFSSMMKCHVHSRSSDDGNYRPQRSTICRLFDVERNELIPNYTNISTDGTFLLFPGPTSQPLSAVVNDEGISRIKRLVVLDCKWSNSSIRLHPSLTNLPQVHLDSVPKHSYFWRWHNAGDNMLSTIEAIYYGAWDVSTTRPDINDNDRSKMVYILWLFGLIREIIQSRYKEGRVQSFIHPPAVPFLESSKELYRLLRKQSKPKNHSSDNEAVDSLR
jgi:DTW domain